MILKLSPEKEKDMSEVISLIKAPADTPLRIVDILGGHGVRRRLIVMGFHKNDTIELDSRAILRGPILVKNLTSDTSVALGRGVAQKIMVEIIE
jgi:Fe2+ transport system protein FeoA